MDCGEERVWQATLRDEGSEAQKASGMKRDVRNGYTIWVCTGLEKIFDLLRVSGSYGEQQGAL